MSSGVRHGTATRPRRRSPARGAWRRAATASGSPWSSTRAWSWRPNANSSKLGAVRCDGDDRGAVATVRLVPSGRRRMTPTGAPAERPTGEPAGHAPQVRPRPARRGHGAPNPAGPAGRPRSGRTSAWVLPTRSSRAQAKGDQGGRGRPRKRRRGEGRAGAARRRAPSPTTHSGARRPARARCPGDGPWPRGARPGPSWTTPRTTWAPPDRPRPSGRRGAAGRRVPGSRARPSGPTVPPGNACGPSTACCVPCLDGCDGPAVAAVVARRRGGVPRCTRGHGP